MADNKLTPAQERDRLKAQIRRRRAEERAMGANVGGAVLGLAASTVSFAIFTKFPRAASLDKGGKIPTTLVLGIPTFFLGLFGGQDAGSEGARDAGLIWTAKGIDHLLRDLPFLQPA